MSQLTRMIYIDDSGHPPAGQAVYGWIEFQPDRWAQVLRSWLDARKWLWREMGVPVTKELHTTDYVNGRDRISTKVPDRHQHDGTTYWKDLGREVAEKCLETIRSTEGLKVGAVHRSGAPRAIAQTKVAAYEALIKRFEDELHADGGLALVFMDGDGSDPSYRTTHRGLRLAERRVIEDAIHIDSRTSQLVQMADLVAWTAHACSNPHPSNAFAQDWYDRFLAERDPLRTPQPI